MLAIRNSGIESEETSLNWFCKPISLCLIVNFGEKGFVLILDWNRGGRCTRRGRGRELSVWEFEYIMVENEKERKWRKREVRRNSYMSCRHIITYMSI